MLQKEMNVRDIVTILQRRWILIASLAILGAMAGYLATRVLPKKFTSETLVLVQQATIPDTIVPTVISDDTNQRLAAMQQQILSRARLQPVIQEFGLYRKNARRLTDEEQVEKLRSAITITPIQPMAQTGSRSLPGFYISVVFDNPNDAQRICAKITSMFTSENEQVRQNQSAQTTEFLSSRLEEAKAALDSQDSKLAEFKRRYLGSLPDEEQTNLNLLNGLNSQLEASTGALARAQQDKSFAESLLAQQTAALEASQSGQNPETLDQQLVALQTQLAALQSKYTDNHPDVTKAKNEIAKLKLKIAANDQQKQSAGPDKPVHTAETPQIQQLRAQIHQYDQMIKERSQQQEEVQKQIRVYQGRIQSTPAVEQEFKQLTRDYQTAMESYTDLLKKRDQSTMATQLEESKHGEQFRVLDPANFPDKASFPKVPFFAAGGMGAGLALGLGITLLLEIQDTSLKTERDVELVLRLPVMGMIPTIVRDPFSPGAAPLPSQKSRSGSRA